jgi:hypothetical protein
MPGKNNFLVHSKYFEYFFPSYWDSSLSRVPLPPPPQCISTNAAAASVQLPLSEKKRIGIFWLLIATKV